MDAYLAYINEDNKKCGCPDVSWQTGPCGLNYGPSPFKLKLYLNAFRGKPGLKY
jgi:hypothetical protein